PLGTWVEVIHLETGRSIQVRVNDRGPFIAGRIIDLSYGAARVLGLLGEGVAPVRVRMLAAGPTAVVATIPLGPTPSPAPQAGRFTMQLGSFTTLENATALARTLQQRFNGVYMVPAEIDGETVYRVRMGSYPNRQEAHVAAEAVAGTGFDVVVMQQE
ncbi:MAG: SPOR domain-containing protein, partial [candidate division NC10 bacterium]|nr:SPOR domain-containing protein [candidate division NC10 bacterium]